MNVNYEWAVTLSVAETGGQTRAEGRPVMPAGGQVAGRGLALPSAPVTAGRVCRGGGSCQAG